MNNTYYTNQINSISAEVKKAVIGKDAIIIKALLALLCKGHILIEDIPGVGKTTLALAFSKALSLEHNRMQFTPDVLPSDVTGFSVYNKSNGKFEFRPGVAFCNLFLADEINRTSSKTQSALLELMEEKSITVDGYTFNRYKVTFTTGSATIQVQAVAIVVIVRSRRPIEADATPTIRRRTPELAGVEEVIWI